MSSEPTFKDKLLLFTAELFGPTFIRLLGITCRYTVEGMEQLDKAEQGGKGVIFAIWHGRMLLPIYHMRNRGICTLVSLHRDGELIARIIQRLGYITRRGSPRAGGRDGFNALVRDLRHGRAVVMNPDGPTGPRHFVREGVMQLARITGAPILPISFAAEPAWRFNSWDRYMVMKPFSRGIFLIQEPFGIPRRFETEKDKDKYLALIRERLIDVEKACDRRFKTHEA